MVRLRSWESLWQRWPRVARGKQVFSSTVSFAPRAIPKPWATESILSNLHGHLRSSLSFLQQLLALSCSALLSPQYEFPKSALGVSCAQPGVAFSAFHWCEPTGCCSGPGMTRQQRGELVLLFGKTAMRFDACQQEPSRHSHQKTTDMRSIKKVTLCFQTSAVKLSWEMNALVTYCFRFEVKFPLNS